MHFLIKAHTVNNSQKQTFTCLGETLRSWCDHLFMQSCYL